MSSLTQPLSNLHHLSITDQGKNKMKDLDEDKRENEAHVSAIMVVHNGVCAICLDNIELQETALIKGCEHAYCVHCILQWATYHEHPKCPQCKHPFESLSVHRSLDGSLHDYMFEESVCLLVRATWFTPLIVDHQDDPYDDLDDIFYYQYQYQYDYGNDEDDLDDVYFDNSPTLRIGNRRWGDNGYVRAGRQEARPSPPTSVSGATSSSSSSRHRKKKKDVECELDASSSREAKTKEVGAGKELMIGRRAKRALKREAADKAAAVKHEAAFG